MAEQITYYAIIDYRATREDPAGLARRVRHDTGFRDEALERDLNWRFTPAIVEWERAESTDDLIEVSEEEADRIVERFRREWARTDG
jgi:hypothetical protein